MIHEHPGGRHALEGTGSHRCSLLELLRAVGRNSYRGASNYDSDIRLQGMFHFADHLSLESAIEGFNLFNHRNVQSIDQVYGAPDFLGPIPRQFGDGIGSPANPTFATPNFTGPARQLQASVRMSF